MCAQMTGSFEYGKDIGVLYESLRAAERLLQEEAAESTVEQDECRIYCHAVGLGIKSIKGTVTKGNINQRMHCALLCDLLVNCGIMKKEGLTFFESILDHIPCFSFRAYFAIIEYCSWTSHFIQALKALPKGVRLALLTEAQSLSRESHHTCFCLASVLAWSVYVEPVQGSHKYEDEIISALSSLQEEGYLHGWDDGLSFFEVLMSCTYQFSMLLRPPASHITREEAVCALRITVHFFSNFLLPSTYSLQNVHQWICDSRLREACPDRIYCTKIPEYECIFQSEHLIDMLRSSEHGFLGTLADFLSSRDVEQLLVEERNCEMADGCMRLFVVKQIVWGQAGTSSLLSELEALEAELNAVLQVVPLVRSLWSIRQLKALIENNVSARKVIDMSCDGIDALVRCLRDSPADCVGLLARILNENIFTENDRLVRGLHNQLCLLSHPVIFPKLLHAAYKQKDLVSLKELTVKTCSAAPLSLQAAMLRLCLSKYESSSFLKMPNFAELLIEKINTVCSVTENCQQVLNGFVSLCLQDPSKVIEELVHLAIRDRCVEVVCEILKTVQAACDHKSSDEPPKTVLEIEMEHSFIALLKEPSKHSSNFVFLVKGLVQNYVLNIDSFLHLVIHYMESAGTRDPFPDECFPLKVFAVLCPHISEDYKHPMLLIVAQLLDKACTLLNAKRKELIVDSLEPCMPHLLPSSENCSGGTKHLIDALQGLNSTCRVALCALLKKAKLEGHLFQVLSESLSDDILLQTKDEWEVTCAKLSDINTGLTLQEITLPYFCERLSSATWEEWEILHERLVQVLHLSHGSSPTKLETIAALTNCVAGCTNCFSLGNWEYFFSCYARLVKMQLQSGVLVDSEIRNMIGEILYSLSVIPAECHRQGIILLLDVAQLLAEDVKDQVTAILKKTLAATESQKLIPVDSLRNKILSHLSRQMSIKEL